MPRGGSWHKSEDRHTPRLWIHDYHERSMHFQYPNMNLAHVLLLLTVIETATRMIGNTTMALIHRTLM